MKVCHISTVHPRYDVRIFEKECRSLAASGYDVTLIVNDQKEDEVIDGVQILSLRLSPRNRFDRMTRIADLAFEEAMRVDAEIYHLHDPELLRIAEKLRKNGKKVIFDSHEFTTEQIKEKPYLPGWSRHIVSKTYKKYEERILQKLSGMIVPCTFEGKNYFSNIPIPKVIIGNCPTKKLVSDTDLPLDQRKNRVAYVGSISRDRGLFEMVRGVSRSGKELVLIGEMSGEDLDELKIMPEYECVHYLGRMRHAEAMEELKKCSVGLCLLNDNGQYFKCDNLPTKMYEYMALGIPVVMSKAPYWEKVLEKYPFGIAVDVKSSDEISSAICELTSDEVTYQNYSREGKHAILEAMNWENDEKKLLELYANL
ncbi:MAG: glycosyltransferase [Lachnospiraceae bacterium]|nr:glycosyltransferase [Lachnospiraceae bacterium]